MGARGEKKFRANKVKTFAHAPVNTSVALTQDEDGKEWYLVQLE